KFVMSRAVVIDVTDRKALEENLRAAHRDLERRVVDRTKRLAEMNSSLTEEVSRRISIEGQLKEKRQLLEAVLQQMPAAVLIAEAPSGRVILSNKQLETLTRQPNMGNKEGKTYKQLVGYYADGKKYRGRDWPLARSLLKGE